MEAGESKTTLIQKQLHVLSYVNWTISRVCDGVETGKRKDVPEDVFEAAMSLMFEGLRGRDEWEWGTYARHCLLD